MTKSQAAVSLKSKADALSGHLPSRCQLKGYSIFLLTLAQSGTSKGGQVCTL